jgi:hypothetical protein
MADGTLDAASLDIEADVKRLQAIADPVARATATELVASVLQLHAAALQRILEIIDESAGNDTLLNKLDADPLVRSILLLHDLHPESTQERVVGALRDIAGKLKKRNASVELVSLVEGNVTLRLMNNGATFGTEGLVEEAVRNAAPEIVNIYIENRTPSRSGFVSVESLRAATVGGVPE